MIEYAANAAKSTPSPISIGRWSGRSTPPVDAIRAAAARSAEKNPPTNCSTARIDTVVGRLIESAVNVDATILVPQLPQRAAVGLTRAPQCEQNMDGSCVGGVRIVPHFPAR